jgi:hypothetical protein
LRINARLNEFAGIRGYPNYPDYPPFSDSDRLDEDLSRGPAIYRIYLRKKFALKSAFAHFAAIFTPIRTKCHVVSYALRI